METLTHYYDYDGLPTRLTLQLTTGRVLLAETYFTGTGLAPINYFPVQKEGTLIDEKQFKKMVVEQR